MSELWTTDESAVLISDRILHLRRERVTTAKGAVLDPYYIMTYPDWAVTVALTERDELVMVRQYRHGTGTVSLELPGGCVDATDPSALHAAGRELLEETGYGGGKLDYVGSLAANPALQTNRLQVAVMTGARRQAEQALEHGEELSVELVPLREAMDLALSGGMEQSMHVAALFLALSSLGRLHLTP